MSVPGRFRSVIRRKIFPWLLLEKVRILGLAFRVSSLRDSFSLSDSSFYVSSDFTSSTVGLSFDDGPSLGSQDLIAYLSANDLSATHFVIGSAIMYNPDIFKAMNVAGVHLGVHTFSHTVQTSKTDLQILGDLGWTSQLIYEVTGKVPMYFRPPEGE